MTSDVTIPRSFFGLLLIWAAGPIAGHAPELRADGVVDWIALVGAIAIVIASGGFLVWGTIQFVAGLWAWARGR